MVANYRLPFPFPARWSRARKYALGSFDDLEGALKFERILGRMWGERIARKREGRPLWPPLLLPLWGLP